MSRQSEIYKTRRSDCRISIDDQLADAEIERSRWARSNGKHEATSRHDEGRLALIPEAIRLADAEVGIADNVGLWSWVYKRHLIRLSDEAIEDASTHHGNGLNNGSASHNGAQDFETNGGPVSSGRSSIDATSAVVPMW